MNTPAHLIVGTAIFARADRKGTYLSALAGAMAPDISLYVMVAVSIWGLGIPARTVFNDYYYTDAWQSVFAVDNSFVLWGMAFGFALWRAMPRLLAFTGAGLLHIALDFPLHTHDARMHFWPVSDWVFISPVSYWDTRAHAGVVGPLEFGLSAGCAILLWRGFQDMRIRAATLAFMAMEAMSTGIWQFIF